MESARYAGGKGKIFESKELTGKSLRTKELAL
jgi:hypothetical protein